jgi:hypothetical protein
MAADVALNPTTARAPVVFGCSALAYPEAGNYPKNPELANSVSWELRDLGGGVVGRRWSGSGSGRDRGGGGRWCRGGGVVWWVVVVVGDVGGGCGLGS